MRADSPIDVPEPELAVLINTHREIVGYAICNDMSSRTIEAENPLYLPQAKIFRGSRPRARGHPCLAIDDPDDLPHLTIARDETALAGLASVGQLHRRLEDLVDWLYREVDFPDGAWLSTGTCLVPDLRSPSPAATGSPSRSPHSAPSPTSSTANALTHRLRTSSRRIKGRFMIDLDTILDRDSAAARGMAQSTLDERADWLTALADALDSEAEALIELAARETHLSLQRLTGELARTTFQLRLIAEAVLEGSWLEATIDHADPDWPMGARPDLRRMLDHSDLCWSLLPATSPSRSAWPAVTPPLHSEPAARSS